jgi:hypothetical protein
MRASVVAVLSVVALAAACEPVTLPAVGSPGGVFDPVKGCTTMEEGGGLCPGDADLNFESADAPRLEIETPTTLTNPRISCVRVHCGTGAFAVRGEYRWNDGVSPSPRMGTLEYRFATPIDLLNKTVSFRVRVDNFVTPMNGQIAVIYKGIFRRIDDGALLSMSGWNTKGGLVSPSNPLMNLNENPTTLPVTAIKVQVYLATEIRRGSDPWVGDIYIDDVTWH